MNDLPVAVFHQLELRLAYIRAALTIDTLDAIGARGGPLKPVASGVYSISKPMLDAYKDGTYANHASNLGALIADELAKEWNVPAYIVDPVTTDDFSPVARISGVPGIARKSRSHALNIKFCFHKACEQHDLSPEKAKFVIAHLGGGFSIAAVSGSKIIDVNDALLGMGPFSVNRAGSIPLAGLLSLVFDRKLSQSELELLFTSESGLQGYLGTSDFRKIENQIDAGDETAKKVVNAMVYQIAKEIGSCYAVLHGQVDGLILTGGLAQSEFLMESIRKSIQFIHPIIVYPGSFESEALAAGVRRVLNGEENPKRYL